MKGLSFEQEETLRDLVGSDLWKVVIAYAEVTLRNHEQDVLSCDVNKPRTLLIKRAQLEGARQVIRALQSAKSTFKIKD